MLASSKSQAAHCLCWPGPVTNPRASLRGSASILIRRFFRLFPSQRRIWFAQDLGLSSPAKGREFGGVARGVSGAWLETGLEAWPGRPWRRESPRCKALSPRAGPEMGRVGSAGPCPSFTVLVPTSEALFALFSRQLALPFLQPSVKSPNSYSHDPPNCPTWRDLWLCKSFPKSQAPLVSVSFSPWETTTTVAFSVIIILAAKDCGGTVSASTVLNPLMRLHSFLPTLTHTHAHTLTLYHRYF